MSSTNRGNSKRRRSDYYVTPVEEIDKFLIQFQEDEYMNLSNMSRVLDPAAGGDENHTMSYPVALERNGFDGDLVTVDIREDSRAEINGQNFFDLKHLGEFDMVITNPPFVHAREFIEHSKTFVPEGGYVVILLRLNFFGSKKRFDFWQDNMPKYCYVHHHRMSFTDDGKTDSIEYMHAVWEVGREYEFTKLKVI